MTEFAFSKASGLWYKLLLWWLRALIWTEKKSGVINTECYYGLKNQTSGL